MNGPNKLVRLSLASIFTSDYLAYILSYEENEVMLIWPHVPGQLLFGRLTFVQLSWHKSDDVLENVADSTEISELHQGHVLYFFYLRLAIS
jgi:hypothetical protein